MAEFKCVAYDSTSGKQLVLHVNAMTTTGARMLALDQALQQMGRSGNIVIVDIKKV